MITRGTKRTIQSIWKILRKNPQNKRPNIIESVGKLPLNKGPLTFVVAVGPLFDQNVPNAMMTFRMGYCNAFEELGIPYIIVDLKELDKVLPSLINPFCMINGSDFAFMDENIIKLLKKYPHSVWVNPLFKNSDKFFESHGLDANIWIWNEKLIEKILNSNPTFVHTATVESGLIFFEGWSNNGVRLISLPLACDTTLYNLSAPYRPEFNGIQIAFVGGYWESKGRQIDKYLRPFEDDLVIYGYDKWPYRGYRGQLSREAEPSLYRQALISPTINEPTVKLLHGQINERVFKVLGCGGVTAVDAVPAYRELFSEDELFIPQDENEFNEFVKELLVNDSLRNKFSKKGYEAVSDRHTYIHRARVVLKEMGLDINKL